MQCSVCVFVCRAMWCVCIGKCVMGGEYMCMCDARRAHTYTGSSVVWQTNEKQRVGIAVNVSMDHPAIRMASAGSVGAGI